MVREAGILPRGLGDVLRLTSVALVALVVLTAAGCQQPSAPSSPITAEVDPAAEGHKAFERQDWATAASRYRVAIQQRPTELILHYRLAIATSWLDLRDEAMQQFEWVVANAATTSDEARVAREWLEGARRRTASAASDATPKNERLGDSGVHGRVVWAEGHATEPLKRFQVHLYGLAPDGTPRGLRFHARTDQDGNYKFEKIPAGIYKLTDDNVGTPKWRLKVEVREGEDALVDLGPENSLSRRDDFPKRS